MFKIEGNRQFVTETSGGGANIEGAIVGGLLFGGAAAIVGSQVGTEIKSSTKEMDNRVISLYYYSNGKLMVENIRSTNIDGTISALRQLIPQKEESVVQLETNKKKQSRITKSTQSNVSTADELKKFKELLDNGVLTQEEFDFEKKKLLEGIQEPEQRISTIHDNSDNSKTQASSQTNTDDFAEYSFFMKVDDVFPIKYKGIAVSGTIEKGEIFTLDEVFIMRKNTIVMKNKVIRMETEEGRKFYLTAEKVTGHISLLFETCDIPEDIDAIVK